MIESLEKELFFGYSGVHDHNTFVGSSLSCSDSEWEDTLSKTFDILNECHTHDRTLKESSGIISQRMPLSDTYTMKQ